VELCGERLCYRDISGFQGRTGLLECFIQLSLANSQPEPGEWGTVKACDIGSEMAILKECKLVKQIWSASISLAALWKMASPLHRLWWMDGWMNVSFLYVLSFLCFSNHSLTPKSPIVVTFGCNDRDTICGFAWFGVFSLGEAKRYFCRVFGSSLYGPRGDTLWSPLLTLIFLMIL